MKQSETEVDDEKLIIFVKAPRPGAVKTRLGEAIGAEASCAAYRQLVEALLRRLQRLSAVELGFSPDDAAGEIQTWLKRGWTTRPQGAGNLGQRLQSAFERAFVTGVKRAVIIGSDCPAVTAEDIYEAWNGLRTHDVVLGPATDGGYWLIGLRRLQPELFHRIPWSTETVFGETMKRIRQAGLDVQLLRELSDVDTAHDWRAFLTAQNRDGIPL
ncbi:MAG: hypothetical protein DME19_09535 [Verrucomicrobia bacterium]|nr:MAG: hypothetical protein DME19_09535 [Verrucomicrobiota bacterium]